MQTRQFRRYQLERLKKARAKYWGFSLSRPPMDQRRLGMVAATPHPCSCWMCRNERQNEGPTIQERRSAAFATSEV